MNKLAETTDDEYVEISSSSWFELPMKKDSFAKNKAGFSLGIKYHKPTLDKEVLQKELDEFTEKSAKKYAEWLAKYGEEIVEAEVEKRVEAERKKMRDEFIKLKEKKDGNTDTESLL